MFLGKSFAWCKGRNALRPLHVANHSENVHSFLLFFSVCCLVGDPSLPPPPLPSPPAGAHAFPIGQPQHVQISKMIREMKDFEDIDGLRDQATRTKVCLLSNKNPRFIQFAKLMSFPCVHV